MDGSPRPLWLILVATLAAIGLIAATTLAGAAEPIGSARKVVNKVYGATLNRRVRVGETIVDRQPVATGAESAAKLMLVDDTILLVGEQSNLTVGARDVAIERGFVRVVTPANSKRGAVLRTGNAVVNARGATLDVFALAGGTDVAVLDGQASVKTRSGAVTVNPGETYRANLGLRPEALPMIAPDLRLSRRKMLAMLDIPDPSPQPMHEKAAEPQTDQAVSVPCRDSDRRLGSC